MFDTAVRHQLHHGRADVSVLIVVGSSTQIVPKLIAMLFTFRSIRKVTIIGDEPHQGLNIQSVYDLYSEIHGPEYFLDLQHRVPSLIVDVLSNVFYEGRLRTSEKKQVAEADKSYGGSIILGENRAVGFQS